MRKITKKSFLFGKIFFNKDFIPEYIGAPITFSYQVTKGDIK